MMVTKYHLGTVAFAGALSLIVKVSSDSPVVPSLLPLTQ